ASDRGVLSLVSCALGKRREETRSSAGGVEALALKKKKGKDQRKNWIPASAGMTSRDNQPCERSAPRGVGIHWPRIPAHRGNGERARIDPVRIDACADQSRGR